MPVFISDFSNWGTLDRLLTPQPHFLLCKAGRIIPPPVKAVVKTKRCEMHPGTLANTVQYLPTRVRVVVKQSSQV